MWYYFHLFVEDTLIICNLSSAQQKEICVSFHEANCVGLLSYYCSSVRPTAFNSAFSKKRQENPILQLIANAILLYVMNDYFL